jgi:hypothetical protein
MGYNIEFSPTSEFTDWVDGADRVTASGDNGFNIRFRSLQTDLETLASRVGDLNAAINDERDRSRLGMRMMAADCVVLDAWSVSMPEIVDNDFFFTDGWAIIDGVPVTGNWSSRRYSQQPWTDPDRAAEDGVPVIPPLTVPSADRDDLVYLDSWEREVDVDGVRRLVREAAVRVREGFGFVPSVPGHLHLELAVVHRKAGQSQITAEQIEDTRLQLDRGPAERAVAVPPLFHPEAFSGWTGWRHTFRPDTPDRLVAAKGTTEQVTGFLPIHLPAGARRIRVVVRCHSLQHTAGGSPLTLALLRVSGSGFDPGATLASVSIPTVSGGNERTLEAPPGHVVDNQSYAYALYAWSGFNSVFEIDQISIQYRF